jgi:UDP-N-acetylglucosamine 4,6-dehydratase/5-epimerase
LFKGKTLLITGGTGSFGNAVLKRFLQTDIAEIRIFSRDEKKQDDMRKLYQNEKIKFHIGDVRDLASVKNALYNVDYVFHAAALKQVPSCEFFPLEAVKTNVLGTDNVLTGCIQEGVKKVICLSTDKAAYPINAMGISKALMEKTALAKARTVKAESTTISCTRYGNVLCSRGSVVPLFVEQIKKNHTITITDPNMTRFLMTLDEAVDLVLYAFQNANPGDLFIQKASSSTIKDLAKAVIELFSPNREVGIDYIGTRHGEKQFETLLTSEEYVKAFDLGDYFKVPLDTRSLNYGEYLDFGNEKFNSNISFDSNNAHMLKVEEIKEKLMTIDFIREELESMKI